MKFTNKSVVSTPEILKKRLGGEYIENVTIASSVFTNADVVKAGTPITSTGTIAATSSDSNNAVGILLNDVYAENPNGALIKAFAVVNAAKGASYSEVTYDAPLKAALPLIVFA